MSKDTTEFFTFFDFPFIIYVVNIFIFFLFFSFLRYVTCYHSSEFTYQMDFNVVLLLRVMTCIYYF